MHFLEKHYMNIHLCLNQQFEYNYFKKAIKK